MPKPRNARTVPGVVTLWTRNRFGMGAALGCVLMAFSGCTTLKPAANGAANAPLASGATQSWQYPASEFPTMCLVLEPGGNARFVGGFLYFNPASWRVDEGSALTLLTVGGGKLPLPPMSPVVAGTKTAVVRVDEETRTLSYRIDPQTASIDFGGFVFFRTARCTAP